MGITGRRPTLFLSGREKREKRTFLYTAQEEGDRDIISIIEYIHSQRVHFYPPVRGERKGGIPSKSNNSKGRGGRNRRSIVAFSSICPIKFAAHGRERKKVVSPPSEPIDPERAKRKSATGLGAAGGGPLGPLNSPEWG